VIQGLGEALDGTTADIMTYCSPTVPSRAVFRRAFNVLLGRSEVPTTSVLEKYANCAIDGVPREPRGTWLRLVGKRSTVLATFAVGRPDAQFGPEALAWSVLDADGGMLLSSLDGEPRPDQMTGTDLWILSVPWDPLAAASLRIERADGEVIDVRPVVTADLSVEATAADVHNHLRVRWPAHASGDAFARIEYAAADDDRWSDLATLVKESDVRDSQGSCAIDVDMKGLAVRERLRVRVSSSSGVARREGTATFAWTVPPPAILWTSPATDVVTAPSLRLAVSAFAPGDGRCLEADAVEWIVDGAMAGKGSQVFVPVGAGVHEAVVCCRDSAGRESRASRTIVVRAPEDEVALR
jgi:hypothetical protein